MIIGCIVGAKMVNPFSVGTNFMTSKVDPRTERINIFIITIT